MPVAALAGMRREQPLPHGLRGLLADLHSAGAAVDFSVLYPAGRLVDAPLPTWTHRHLFIDDERASPKGARCQQHRRASAAGRARAAARGAGAPRLAGRRRHRGAAVAGRSPGPQRGRPSRGRLLRDGVGRGSQRCSARQSEVRDIRFEQMLLLDEQTPIDAVASVDAPGVVDFVVETDQDGEAHAARHRGRCMPQRTRPATCVRHRRPARGAPGLAWTAPSCGSGSTSVASSRSGLQPVWPPRTPRRRRKRHRAGRGRTALPRFARSRPPTACTRRCWMPVSSPSRLIPASRTSATAVCCCRWVCAGCAPTDLPATPATATRG